MGESPKKGNIYVQKFFCLHKDGTDDRTCEKGGCVMRRSRNQKILSMVEMAMLTALVVVLQIFGGMIKIPFLPFSFSLVLIPIVIGSIVLDYKHGTVLGIVFGLVVVAQCAMGIDAGGFILWGINPFLTAAICIVKGAAAGFVPGIIYKAIIGNKKATDENNSSDARAVIASVIAAISAPIANTGIFVIGLSAFFNSTLVAWAGGANVMLYIVTGLVGVNFLIELFINVIVSPAISTIIKVTTKQLTK